MTSQGYPDELYGLREGVRVVGPDGREGVVTRVGPEAYTRDLCVFVTWDDGSQGCYVWNAAGTSRIRPVPQKRTS